MSRLASSSSNSSKKRPIAAKLLLLALPVGVFAMGRSLRPELMNLFRSDSASVQQPAPFYPALTKVLKKRKLELRTVCPGNDSTAKRVLEDYGAVFLVDKQVMPPPACVFQSEDEVTRFQTKAGFESESVGDVTIELQPAAMKAYRKARDEAQKQGFDITPREGPESARRSYSDSKSLWDSRFLPALAFWTAQGRLTSEQAEKLRDLPVSEQISAVLDLEKQGLFFSKDFSKSILYSVAAPGSSQHLAMLALDVAEFQDPRARIILANHGWFQTVYSDLPHFTYLGLKEKDLPKRGLKSVELNGQIFWIPNVETIPAAAAG